MEQVTQPTLASLVDQWRAEAAKADGHLMSSTDEGGAFREAADQLEQALAAMCSVASEACKNIDGFCRTHPNMNLHTYGEFPTATTEGSK